MAPLGERRHFDFAHSSSYIYAMPNKDQTAFPYNSEATRWNEADGIA